MSFRFALSIISPQYHQSVSVIIEEIKREHEPGEIQFVQKYLALVSATIIDVIILIVNKFRFSHFLLIS